MPFGSVSSLRLSQPQKTLSSILSSPSGSLTDESAFMSEKAFLPILVTAMPLIVFGTVSFVTVSLSSPE